MEDDIKERIKGLEETIEKEKKSKRETKMISWAVSSLFMAVVLWYAARSFGNVIEGFEGMYIPFVKQISIMLLVGSVVSGGIFIILFLKMLLKSIRRRL